MKRIGIIAKLHADVVRGVLQELEAWLVRHERDVLMDIDTAALIGRKSPIQKSRIPEQSDLIIVLGGDGTLLSVARLAAGRDVPILGVNLGGLGFLTEVTLEELFPTIEKIFNKDYVTDDRLMIQGVVRRQGEVVARSAVLNDVVVSKGTLARMIRIEIFVNNQFVTSLRGDGAIVATPTGSTAYSISAGGPILHPSVAALLVTPICPHMLTNRPIVIPDQAQVEMVIRTQEEGTTVTFDGQVGFSLRQNDVVEVVALADKIRLIRSPERNYFEVLRRKLKWGEG